MSLTASMWTSVSGLLNHGEKMNVIGNNIANVNTVAFKGQRMDFMDFVYANQYAAGGPTQVGMGVSIGAIYGDFGQGAFESSTESTDMAINGNGFFKVIPKYSNEEYFTRAGNFRFDSDGYLCNPQGYVLQGWAIEQPVTSAANAALLTNNQNKSPIVGTGVPVDVRLSSFSCEPRHTSTINWAINLDSEMGEERTTDATEPFAALLKKWNVVETNGQIAPPLGNDGFAYQQSITVYDEGGGAHVLTVYFDKVEKNLDPASEDPGKDVWEYIVTMDPREDNRTFGVDGADPVDPDKRGLLMSGTLTFNSSGLMTDMTAYVPTEGANIGDTSTWIAAPISTNGYPMFVGNFTGLNNASNIWSTLPYDSDLPNGGGVVNQEVMGKMTELNLGFRCTNDWWGYPAATGTAGMTLGAIGDNLDSLYGMNQYGERQNPASTSYPNGGTGFYERYAKQDGYTHGELTSIHVTDNGILTGRYSNGVTLELFQITLYDFNAKHELHRDGGNLFTQTRESGDPTQGAAGMGSFGSILGNNIEQSNVDISREFVQMITTQRGFQSNSKLITTTDTMLENVINMKR